MSTKERIGEIVKLRQDLLDEMQALQKACTHDEYHIGTYSWRVGAYDEMRICEECGSCFEKPSDEENDDFKREMEHDYNLKNNNYEPSNDPNIIYVKPYIYIGQGTKIYKRDLI